MVVFLSFMQVDIDLYDNVSNVKHFFTLGSIILVAAQPLMYYLEM